MCVWHRHCLPSTNGPTNPQPPPQPTTGRARQAQRAAPPGRDHACAPHLCGLPAQPGAMPMRCTCLSLCKTAMLNLKLHFDVLFVYCCNINNTEIQSKPTQNLPPNPNPPTIRCAAPPAASAPTPTRPSWTSPSKSTAGSPPWRRPWRGSRPSKRWTRPTGKGWRSMCGVVLGRLGCCASLEEALARFTAVETPDKANR